MSFADRYLSKQKDFSPIINIPPEENLKYIVVVPCYREPQIISSIESLRKSRTQNISLEVIVVINYSENDSSQTVNFNASTEKELVDWANINNVSNFKLFVRNITNIPRKFAGVGYARKFGMDEAISRFNNLNKKDGVIISFDADSICDENFISEIDLHYIKNPKTTGTTVYFEHPIDDAQFDSEILQAICKYELHLRYFVQALRLINFQYAYHTVGSCFNVKAEAYVKQGGMNRRQGGEDFYFLHKIIPLGNFHEINSTRVVPSPRASNRVPFGTGPVISRIIESDNKKYESYQFEAFLEIKHFLDQLPDFYKSLSQKENLFLTDLPKGVKSFLESENIEVSLTEVFNNSSTYENFKKRFYYWFDAFKLIKCLNYLHESVYNKNEIEAEAIKLLKQKIITWNSNSAKELLKIYRKLDKESEWH
jgi:hypothetical protein